MLDEKTKIIKCMGCGQVGMLMSGAQDAFGGRQRRQGFYLHTRRDGVQVVACCKCQQTQPREVASHQDENH